MLSVNYPATQPDAEDQLLLGRYQQVSEIFRGKYSHIFCMKDITSQRQFSCKKFPLAKLTSHQVELIRHEATLAQKSMFPGQMKYNSIVLDQKGGSLIALVDLHKYGDLRTQLDTAIMEDFFFSEDTIWMIATQLIKFLADYSSQTATKDKILLDLRPSCIYISETGFILVDTVRLARFDLFPESTDYETPCYNAPELLAGARHFHTMDIWSLGATLFELCMRRPYLTGWTRQQVLELSLTPPNIIVELTTNSANARFKYSERLSNFITDLLNPRPERRPNTDDLITCSPIAELMNIYKELLRVHYYKRKPRIARMSTCACGGNMDDCCGYRRYLKKLAAEPPYSHSVSYTRVANLSGNTYNVVNNWTSKQGKEHPRRYMLSKVFSEPRTRPLGAKRPIQYNQISEQPSVFSNNADVAQSSSISSFNPTTSFSPSSSISMDEQPVQQSLFSSKHDQEITMDDKSEITHQPTIQDQCMCDQGVGTPSPVTLQDIITNVPSLELVRDRTISPNTHRFISSQHMHSSTRKLVKPPAQHNTVRCSPNFLKQSVTVSPIQPYNMRISYNSVKLTDIYESRPNMYREQPSSMHISSIQSSTQ
ncbi:Kinase, NEK [Giardia lamblia P15]|uniref:non-specific serine/threonine protein kinase n=1 Tax=Giardia intestinalis (strain P15) TaxID=658858 RepID=E1EZC4_GIAIA|nr:Kinase, NEK [Giardia lamblia P15]